MNTPTFRDKKGVLMAVCAACNGAGGVHHYDLSNHYPGNEMYEPCAQCCGAGSIRALPFDPLETLAAERRGIVSLRDRPEYLRRSATTYYNRAKATAMAPVQLP